MSITATARKPAFRIKDKNERAEALAKQHANQAKACIARSGTHPHKVFNNPAAEHLSGIPHERRASVCTVVRKHPKGKRAA